MSILLSIIIPVVEPKLDLQLLLKSLVPFIFDARIEVIIVNQSGKRTDYCSNTPSVREHILTQVVPAANARNIGATLAKGEYLFFLDDDALVICNREGVLTLIHLLETNKYDIVLAQRGEVVEGEYISHWPSAQQVNYKNFPRFSIEWNVIINKKTFLRLGAFPNIGAGSKHAALSGECFVLMARGIAQKIPIVLCPAIKVAHPSLITKPKAAVVALGYAYGDGYAIGLSQKFFLCLPRLYWIIRVSTVCILGPLRHYLVKDERIENLGIVLYKVKFLGFIDGILGRPKSQKWLTKKIKK